jgi:citrate synthase
MEKKYCTSEEVQHILGITAGTVYSYVSRGMLRSEQSSENARQRVYHTEDVRKLLEKRTGGTTQASGDVLETSITRVTENGLQYRGVDVRKLADNASFEQVLSLLWTGSKDAEAVTFNPAVFSLQEVIEKIEPNPVYKSFSPARRCFFVLGALEPADSSRFDSSSAGTLKTVNLLFQLTVRILTGLPYAGSLSALLSECWELDTAQAEAVNSALIICADYEPDIPVFTARAGVSCETTAYGALIAALAIIDSLSASFASGSLFLAEAAHKGFDSAAGIFFKAGIKNFGLNPNTNDMRGSLILQKCGNADCTAFLRSCGKYLNGQGPSAELALLKMENSLKLPEGSSEIIYLLSRTAGITAHIAEQITSGNKLKLKSVYTGQ